jgi:DNA-binding winged helix-turn-helix (wHTH) protein
MGMDTSVPEASYPIEFQKKEAERLGRYLQQRQCVNFVGMKRVGISNFLRFFLSRDDIIPTYIDAHQSHLFIPVDLHDLVERELYPFWTLTLKRIVDAAEASTISPKTKQKIRVLFDKSIQSQDLFLVIDNIRQAVSLIVESGMFPTIFFLRFDRLKDKFNPSFFENLEGLRGATNNNLAFVFTSYRSLKNVFPYAKTLLSALAHTAYAKPIDEKDVETIYEEYCGRYGLKLSEPVKKSLFAMVGGYVQYLQLALIILTEKEERVETEQDLLSLVLSDERILLQSEELYESLSKDEKKVLLDVLKGKKIEEDDKERGAYLWDTGFIYEKDGKEYIFSNIFERFLHQIEEEESRKNKVDHLTRKENLLFNVLKLQVGDICERDKIIEGVWPEYQEFGVSDWAIDRLVARVRMKLREQGSPYEIVTVRTRGYKLTMAKA